VVNSNLCLEQPALNVTQPSLFYWPSRCSELAADAERRGKDAASRHDVGRAISRRSQDHAPAAPPQASAAAGRLHKLLYVYALTSQCVQS